MKKIFKKSEGIMNRLNFINSLKQKGMGKGLQKGQQEALTFCKMKVLILNETRN